MTPPPPKQPTYHKEPTPRRRSQWADVTLYPREDDLSKVTIESTNSVFNRLSRRTSLHSHLDQITRNNQMPFTPSRGRAMSYDISSSYSQTQSRPGAFHHTGVAPEKKKDRPALPKWVEEHTKPDVERKLEASKATRTRKKKTGRVTSARPSRRQSPPMSDGSSGVASLPASPADSDDDNDYYLNERTAENRTSHPDYREIEVSPGQFLELRRSHETMQALDGGYAVSVSCCCCQVRMKTVPDADYVICPDCRVLSPVPDEMDSLEDDMHNSSFDDVYATMGDYGRRNGVEGRRRKHFTRERVGGVGLGLKVAYE